MAISSPGIGSGLNITSIVSQLVAVESQPITLLQTKNSTIQTKMSAFGTVKSDLSAVQDAANALMNSSTWDSKGFSTDNTTAVSGTATSSALASSFTLEVGNLASAQSLKTAGVATTYTAPTTGTLSFQLGSWDSSGTFTAGSSSAVSVNVTAGDSLATIAASINAQSSAAGVTATVVSSNGTQQLLLRGTSTGAQSGFQITASSGLGAFGFTDPSSTTGMTRTQTAVDANLSIDGIPITSATNTVANAVPGLTLNLLAKTTSPATVTIAVDNTAIKTKIQAFQDAYNKLNSDLATYTAYNATTKTGGPLLGDSTATGIQTALRSMLGANGPASSTISRLSDLGLQIQADGSLSTNSTKLDNALQDTKNVKAFFASAAGSTASTGDGIARRIYNFAFGALGIGGTVTTHSAGFQKSIDQNNSSIDKLNTHIAAYQKQLLAQYNALDTKMATLTSLSTYVTQQITQWNKSG